MFKFKFPNSIREYSFLISLYIVGLLHWIYFFNFGFISFSAFDWYKEYEYYYILKQSLLTFNIPFHVSQYIQGTQRFLAIPEINLSPLIVLLPFYKIGNFILLNTLVMYSFGFIGTVLIIHNYKLSILPSLFLFFLINFNGHITSHLSVGHSMWSGYFLLPLLFYFILRLFENIPNNNISIKIALVLSAMLLVGSIHIYFWSFVFLFLIAAFNLKYFKVISKSIGLSFLLGIFRIIPSLISYNERVNTFITGYDSTLKFAKAFLTINSYFRYRIAGEINLDWWEYDIYIGIIGVLFISFFGIYLRFNKNLSCGRNSFRQLDLPLLIMILLSLGSIYKLIFDMHLHFLTVERISTRFLIMPVFMLFIISSSRLQNILEKYQALKTIRIILAFGFLFLAYSLFEHSYAWRIAATAKNFSYLISEPDIKIIIKEDYSYKLLEALCTLASAITMYLIIHYMIKKKDLRVRKLIS